MKNLEIKEVSAEELNDGVDMTLGVIAGALSAGIVLGIGFAVT